MKLRLNSTVRVLNFSITVQSRDGKIKTLTPRSKHVTVKVEKKKPVPKSKAKGKAKATTTKVKVKGKAKGKAKAKKAKATAKVSSQVHFRGKGAKAWKEGEKYLNTFIGARGAATSKAAPSRVRRSPSRRIPRTPS